MVGAPRRWFVLAGGVIAGTALACGGSDLLLPSDSRPAALSAVQGNNQSARAGTALPDSLVVRVTDASNRPVAQLRIAFVQAAGTSGGSFGPDTAVTDVNGNARSRWTLGPSAGAQNAEAHVVGTDGLKATFSATATAGTAATIALVSGNNQAAVAGTTLPESLVVRASDAQGNPVPGLPVAWSVTGGGAVSPANTVTGSDGRAATQRTLGPNAGAQSAVATAAGVPGSPVTFAATAIVGSPGTLTITTQPSGSAIVGATFTQQPRVQVRDALGNPVKQAGLAVQAAIASGTGGTLGGQLTAGTDANGLATFTDLFLAGTPGVFTLRFSTAGLVPAVSDPIALVGAGPSAARSTLGAAPASIAAGTGASTVTVTVLDDAGQPVPNVSVVPATTGAGAFAPTSAPANAQGVATFSFTSPAVGTETISATAGGVLITQTAVVNVTAQTTTTTITGDTPDPSIVGQPVTVTFTVTAAVGTPTGTVNVSDGTAGCSASVAVGQCVLTPTTPGDKTLTATFAGSGSFAASSGSAPHQVARVPTVTTVVGATPEPSLVGKLYTVQFTVTAQGASPTGSVTVSDGAASCTATVAAGQCSLTSTTAGNKTLTATYAAQGIFAASSGTAPHTVAQIPTTTTLGAAPAVGTVGQNVTFTATVTTQGNGIPTGQVQFVEGSCASPTTSKPFDKPQVKALDATGKATFRTKDLPFGTHAIQACYLGTTTFQPSQSLVLLYVVGF
jgi:hypothetical protein